MVLEARRHFEGAIQRGSMLAMNLPRWSSVILMWLSLLSAAPADKVARIHVNGAIGPATAGYIARGIREAHSQGAQCLIIQLDTPGGLLDSTKTIVQELLAAPLPTVVYVAPSGATATSAGCFITLAADVAAMAPATTIGAAHPVQMGGGGTSGEQKVDETMKEKLENYAISYIETIAARRKRNIEWARSSVKESASITAEKALELKVVEIIAKDTNDLLSQLHGGEASGKKLNTAGANVVEIRPSFAERVFQTLWRPEVMFILMLIAVYGIIGELSNPGAIFPGVVGAIALVLALYMAAILPVNAAGLALIALAIALFIIDVFAPTHGILTAGGIGAFLIGSLMLFDRAEPVFRLSLAFIIPAAIVTALFFAFIVGSGLRAQLLPGKAGVETMLGKTVKAITRVDSSGGKVFIEGEYWNAVSDPPVEEGQPVQVTAVKGLTLEVKPIANTQSSLGRAEARPSETAS
jgi:membrane-bound serine protease (ClpP class)